VPCKREEIDPQCLHVDRSAPAVVAASAAARGLRLLSDRNVLDSPHTLRHD
jgi:hypothetical protein